uniref:Uncharacterized protein n=1 Tax=Meloidogyne enterolobii TaxID=390850 RepID=A0A6V7UW11_MELEN|nr:unnamed protein product [Meloidogyne enterolobii]
MDWLIIFTTFVHQITINLEVYNMEDSSNILVEVFKGKVVIKEEVNLKSVEEVEEDVDLEEGIKCFRKVWKNSRGFKRKYLVLY